MAADVPQTFDDKSAAAYLEDVASPMAAGQKPVTAQDTSWSRYPKLAVNALVGGANMLLGTPGAINQLGNEAVFGLGNWLTGRNLPRPVTYGTPQQLFGITDALGLTNRPEAIPTTPAERYATAAVEGAIPGVLGGPVGALAGGTGGVVGQGVHDLAPGAPGWTAPVAGLVAGGLVAGGTGLARNALMGRAVNRELAGAATELQAAEAAHKLADEAHFLGPAERQAALAAHNATITQQLDEMASRLGMSTTKEDAGQWLQAHARNWLSDIFPQRAAMLAEPLDAAIPAGTQVDLTPYKQVLESVTSKAGKLQSSANVVRSGEAQQLLARLTGPDELEALATGGTAPPPMASWEDARALRSEIGDALNSPKLSGNKDLEAAYSGLTKALSKTAESVGAGDAWNQYNTGMSQLYGFIKGPLSKIIRSDTGGRETILPAQAYSGAMSLSGKGGATLAALRAEMPDAANELGAVVLRNPEEWTRLSPEAKAALAPGPGQSSVVDSLLESKAAAAAAAKAEGRQLATTLRGTRTRVAEARQRVDAAKNALMGNKSESSALAAHLVHTALGAGLGWGQEHSMRGVLLGALAGRAAPLLWRGLQTGLAPQQLYVPALAGYGAFGPEAAGAAAQLTPGPEQR